MGKGKNVVPPFKESQLTRILQNALGGNSKSLMIFAISPATLNYEETLSTLRYADQVKKIKNCAVVNESDVDKKLRQYQEEIYQLKQQLISLQQKIQCNIFIIQVFIIFFFIYNFLFIQFCQNDPQFSCIIVSPVSKNLIFDSVSLTWKDQHFHFQVYGFQESKSKDTKNREKPVEVMMFQQNTQPSKQTIQQPAQLQKFTDLKLSQNFMKQPLPEKFEPVKINTNKHK